MRNTLKVMFVVAAVALLGVTPAGAQSVGPRWQAWLGCWSSATPGESYGSAQFAPPVVCITPTANSDVVEVATVVDGKVTKRDTIDASGVAHAIESKGCEGSQSARWSGDERRVYLRSASSCDGMKTSASSILALTAGGDWIDVRGISAGEGENVRVAHYHDIGLPATVPADIADVLRGRTMRSQNARISAGANIGSAAVTEAVHSADSEVVEAFLLERGQKFALNANTLVTLADAGVPSGVTDAMVAVSNPGAFEMARADDHAIRNSNEDEVYGRRIPVYLDPYYSPWGWGYSPYGYNRYGYGYGSAYGSGYGYPGYYGGAPIIVVTGTQASGGSGGQMVKGRGYTQGPDAGSSSGRTASPSNSGAASSGSSASSAPQQQPQPQAQPAPQRTAKPRP